MRYTRRELVAGDASLSERAQVKNEDGWLKGSVKALQGSEHAPRACRFRGRLYWRCERMA